MASQLKLTDCLERCKCQSAYGDLQIDPDILPRTLWVLGFVTSSRALQRDGLLA
jgi:hypothetical protein